MDYKLEEPIQYFRRDNDLLVGEILIDKRNLTIYRRKAGIWNNSIRQIKVSLPIDEVSYMCSGNDNFKIFLSKKAFGKYEGFYKNIGFLFWAGRSIKIMEKYREIEFCIKDIGRVKRTIEKINKLKKINSYKSNSKKEKRDLNKLNLRLSKIEIIKSESYNIKVLNELKKHKRSLANLYEIFLDGNKNTARELIKKTGKTGNTIYRNLRKLRKLDLIEKEGPAFKLTKIS